MIKVIQYVFIVPVSCSPVPMETELNHSDPTSPLK